MGLASLGRRGGDYGGSDERTVKRPSIHPTADRVAVRRVESDAKTPGGIYIPDAAKEKPAEGVVIAVGPGRYEAGELVPMGVKVNDRVLFGKYSGTEVKVDGDELVLLSESDLLAVLR